jgi:hypothetical protein
MVTSQTTVEERHVLNAWDMIKECASALSAERSAIDVD